MIGVALIVIASIRMVFVERKINKKKEQAEKELQEIQQLHRAKETELKHELILAQEKQFRQLEDWYREEQETLRKNLEVHKAARIYELKSYEDSERTKIEEVLRQYSDYIASEMEEETRKLFQCREEVESAQADLENALEDAASRYVSIVESERALMLEKEEGLARTIRVNELDREDISYLLTHVVPRIRRPEIMRKLIWSEYIQTPTTKMLSVVLPQDVAGIYKITYIGDKRCYIGRSTSVRKRLIEHVKSSIGVGNIAHQDVHNAMAELGIQNFTFELIEECEKEKLSEREKYYIDFYQSTTHGFNANKGG